MMAVSAHKRKNQRRVAVGVDVVVAVVVAGGVAMVAVASPKAAATLLVNRKVNASHGTAIGVVNLRLNRRSSNGVYSVLGP